jgi:hypothetical protein
MSEVVPPIGKHDMRNEDHAHSDRVIGLQGALTRRKYAAGRLEHGGSLWAKPGMVAHALDEVTDLSVYLWTLRDQVSHIAAELRTAGITAEDAADALDRLLRQ